MPEFKSRLFCITNYHELDKADDRYKQIIDEGKATYIAYGKEVCPTTKKEHHQMWVYFKQQKGTGKRSLNQIGKLITGVGSHTESMKGSLDSNEAYCSKEGTYTCHGDKPKPGRRVDLEDVVNDIIGNKRSVDEITLENPMLYQQYGRTLSKVEDITLRKRFRTEMTEGIWYHGPTGGGKSHQAFEGFDPDTHYVKPLEDEWWDGYTGQETVILNEFRGQLKYSEMLSLTDKWPHYVRRRNREPAPFLAKRVIVTSSKHPATLYEKAGEDDHCSQLLRRFEIVRIAQR